MVTVSLALALAPPPPLPPPQAASEVSAPAARTATPVAHQGGTAQSIERAHESVNEFIRSGSFASLRRGHVGRGLGRAGSPALAATMRAAPSS